MSQLGARAYRECSPIPDKACVEKLAQETGASMEALAFLAMYDGFLVDFEEHGPVDFGASAAPWYNMGRPEPIFINGDFGVLSPSAVLPDDWHDSLPADLPDTTFFWHEYAELVDADEDSAGQRFRIKFPVRECRVCRDDGDLLVDYRFDRSGSFVDAEIQTFEAK